MSREQPWYLGTPFAKHPAGIEYAFKDACRQAALLTKAGIFVFCPIAHSYPMALHGGIKQTDHDFWMDIDEGFMDVCRGMIFCKMESWEISRGMAHEKKYFLDHDKPVIEMTPDVVPMELWGKIYA